MTIREDLRSKKFVSSYSGGKDSILAMYTAIKAGLAPMELLTVHNKRAIKVWFHGTGDGMSAKISKSLELPHYMAEAPSATFMRDYWRTLAESKARGAEVCVYGDTCVSDFSRWSTQSCEKAGLIPFYPLIGMSHTQVVYEFIESGFSAVIAAINTDTTPEYFLGRELNAETVQTLEKEGIDVCGEAGEFHTFVYDGPIFKSRVDFAVKDKFIRGKTVSLVFE